MSELLLTLDGVGVNYANMHSFRRNRVDKWVWRNLSLKLHRGESLGVIGRNGIGKSTLIRVMAGVMAPDEGKVILRKNCTISMLALGTGFLPELTGRENIFLSGLLLGMRKEKIAERMEEIIAFSELGDSIDNLFYTYSSGMKARLGFSLAMQRDPDILLLDEALGVGDALFRKKSTNALKERILGDQTVVLVSHSPRTIQELCNRAIWIEGGKIQAEGSVEDVTAEYDKYIKYLEAKREANK